MIPARSECSERWAMTTEASSQPSFQIQPPCGATTAIMTCDAWKQGLRTVTASLESAEPTASNWITDFTFEQERPGISAISGQWR